MKINRNAISMFKQPSMAETLRLFFDQFILPIRLHELNLFIQLYIMVNTSNYTLIFFCLKPIRIISIIDHFFFQVWLPLFRFKGFKLYVRQDIFQIFQTLCHQILDLSAFSCCFLRVFEEKIHKDYLAQVCQM